MERSERLSNPQVADYPDPLVLGPHGNTETYELRPDLLVLHFSEAFRQDGAFDEDQIQSFLVDHLDFGHGDAGFHHAFLAEHHIDGFQAQSLAATGMRLVPVDTDAPLLDQAESFLARSDGELKTVTPVYQRVGWGFDKAATPLFYEILALISTEASREQAILELHAIYDGFAIDFQEEYKDHRGFGRLLAARIDELQVYPRQSVDRYLEVQQAATLVSVESGWMRLFPFGSGGYTQLPVVSDQWHLDIINVGDHVWSGPNAITGQGVRVGIVDDGFEHAHPDLNFIDGKNFDRSGLNPDPANWGPHPYSGHGTMVAGLIGARRGAGSPRDVVGVAPACDLVGASVGPGAGPYEVFDAIAWLVTKQQIAVLNLSLYTVASSVVAEAIDIAVSKYDVLVCAAAGSAGASYCDSDTKLCPRGIDFPASMPAVLAVGAVANGWGERKHCQTNDREHWQSQWDAYELDVVAPGVLLWTTDELGPNGLTVKGELQSRNLAPPQPSGTTDGNYYAIGGGTSGATALVSGLAALIRSIPGKALSAAETRTIIEATCTKALDIGKAQQLKIARGYRYEPVNGDKHRTKSDATGYGLINCGEALKLAEL